MAKTIVIIEFHQETNSFSQVPTTIREFESLALYYGDDVFLATKKLKFQLAGFLKAVEKSNCSYNIVPTVAAWAISGGPIEREVYDHFKNYILEIIASQPQVDGIYLSMHGAMGVEGLRDPESDMLGAIRDLVGDVPLGVSYDLHANITKEKVRLASFINAYRTNPHRDHFNVGYKAGKILLDMIEGKVNPVMSFLKMPLLKGGGMTLDFLGPMRAVFSRMKKMESNPKVLSVSNFMSHIWLDDEEMGWSCIAVTDGDKALADQLVMELAELNWQRKHRKHPEPISIETALNRIKAAWFRRLIGTAIICDVSDIVAAGAPGENTHIVDALIQHAPGLRSYVPLRDANLALQLSELPIGQQASLDIGQKLDTQYNRSLSLTGIIMSKNETEFGKTVVVKHKNVFLVITEIPNPVYKPAFFRNLGLSPWKADIIVVKNLFPFRLFYFWYNRQTLNVATNGTTNLDVHQLAYTKIPRPIYPLDEIEDWQVHVDAL